MDLPLPPADPSRIGFMGTPALAVPFLDALMADGYEVPLVVTRPDARRGRRGHAEPSAVKAAAEGHGLEVSHSPRDMMGHNVDLAMVVAYGRLITDDVLSTVPLVNVHFSLLPRWRGAAPLERAILAGDSETGVCLMQIEETLDTGSVYACQVVPVTPDDTLDGLRQKLTDVGVELMRSCLRDGFPSPEPQQGEAVYAEKITAKDLHLDWTRPSEILQRQVRLGGAWTTFRGRRFKIHEVASHREPELEPGAIVARDDDPVVGTGDLALRLQVVQPEGRPLQDARDWLHGARLQSGEKFEVES